PISRRYAVIRLASVHARLPRPAAAPVAGLGRADQLLQKRQAVEGFGVGRQPLALGADLRDLAQGPVPLFFSDHDVLSSGGSQGGWRGGRSASFLPSPSGSAARTAAGQATSKRRCPRASESS